MKLKISEIFCSIQGESTFSGLPSVFVRTTGCNLRCLYCDTQYAYEEGEEFSIDQVLQEIERFLPIKLIAITGGEPLLQDNICELIASLLVRGYQILIETNGSVSLRSLSPQVHKIVDVKCPGSGCADKFLVENLLYMSDKDELKFVISDLKDYSFAKRFLSAHSLPTEKILFSPVAEILPPHKLAEWIVADRLKVRMQIQLHKIIWDAETRGV